MCKNYLYFIIYDFVTLKLFFIYNFIDLFFKLLLFVEINFFFHLNFIQQNKKRHIVGLLDFWYFFKFFKLLLLCIRYFLKLNKFLRCYSVIFPIIMFPKPIKQTYCLQFYHEVFSAKIQTFHKIHLLFYLVNFINFYYKNLIF